MQKRFLLGAALCGLFFGGTPALPADDALASGLDKILDAPALRGGITGVIVQRVSDGKIVYTHNPDTRLLPASNRKLFTSAAALELLGDSFTYTTRVLATAKPDADGVLDGDLVLKGVGDSSLKTADLDDLAAQVAKSGVKRIIGNIYGDGSAFTDGPYGFGWEWDDLSDSEFPQIAGLEVNDGDVTITATGGITPGQPVRASESPVFGGAAVDNTARTESKGNADDLKIQRAYDQSDISVSGALPVGVTSTLDVPIVDPPAYAAAVLRAGLIANGITIAPPLSEELPHRNGVVPAATIRLASHTSVPIASYVALMNKPSDNLLAESLVRTLGVVKGAGGTYDAGHAVETPFFKSLGVPVDDIALVDGCGVGRRNFVTARSVGQLLVGMHGKADWKTYYDSLPIAGIDGTLRTRMVGTPAQGNVYAKTGTLSQVRCLSGYFTGSQGTLYAFSLLMNNFPGTAREAGAVQDQFVLFLVQSL